MEAVPFLRRGMGARPQDGGCIMQVVDWVSTGGWTDHPTCVHRVLADVAIVVNDGLSDDERQQLLDLIPRLLNTRDNRLDDIYSTMVDEFNRRWWGADWESQPVPQLQPGFKAEYTLDLLRQMLDKADDVLGRTSHEPVDLTGVCAVMATA